MALPQSSLFGEEPDDDSFWLKLMSECLENPVTKLPTDRRLLVLGDNDAEKTLLVTKLQGGIPVNFTKGNGLEFRHLTVKDEYRENQTKLGVWILDGDPFYKPLLKYALDRDCLSDTTVLVVASMTKPWDIMDTVGTWTDILRDHIESLDVPESRLESRKAEILERFREYVEPGLSIYGSLATDSTRELSVNIGIELIVVVTRTEYMKELQTEFGYEEEHFDFIQLSLREFCLSHGAALFYVSVRGDKNCDLLLKYILHKIYSLPFRLPAVLVERDSILVPAGWDTKNKIRFLSDTLTTIPRSTPFEDVVFRPSRLFDAKGVTPEIMAGRDQDFLAEMQAALERPEERAPESETVSSMTASVVQRNVARRMTRPQPRSPQKKLEAKLVSGDGDNTLSNFFHSLLNRRTSAPVDRPVGLTGARTLNAKNSSARGISRDEASSKSRDRAAVRNHNLNEIDERRKSSEESSGENDCEEEDNSHSRLKKTAHLSLDQDDKAHQLPEYFLSNAEEAGFCSPECSFQGDSDFDDQFSPPLDRVRSSFNPPLKQLLEKEADGHVFLDQPVKMANGEATGNGEGATLKNGHTSELDKNSKVAHVPPFPELVKPDSVMSSMPFKASSHDQNAVDGT